jgi:hypothetical protein
VDFPPGPERWSACRSHQVGPCRLDLCSRIRSNCALARSPPLVGLRYDFICARVPVSLCSPPVVGPLYGLTCARGTNQSEVVLALSTCSGVPMTVMTYNTDCRVCDLRHQNGDNYRARMKALKDVVRRRQPDIMGTAGP